MTSPDPAGAIAAATVIVVRDGADGLEILAIERAKGMGFAGGAIAFPGGKVDPGDAPSTEAFIGFAGLAPDDAIARVAAAREAFEESGILFSAGPVVDHGTRTRLRPASDSHAIGFAELLGEIGHSLDAAVLRPFARWLPPMGLHKRFDTRFYVAALPEGEVMLADGHEAVHARWATPALLLREADEGLISLLFPTRCNIARLGQFASAAALLADETPPPFVQPDILEDGWLSIPEGIGYPYVRERLERVRRE
ncbi:NUDIX hydrolase [Sandaracinobacter neustonicus]|uniref:NUDIX hydrolase n=1 Tax=Sandaracinobacter neustonicus TaxID=1715348 RepID=A0A501XDZ6_9SPHN|nr:NUDIX domain-containing protein [Sandaracinobacter neustonicus]TPE58504.1 NUDIX hydrolase [Sandaracinobacter neustonicus]